MFIHEYTECAELYLHSHIVVEWYFVKHRDNFSCTTWSGTLLSRRTTLAVPNMITKDLKTMLQNILRVTLTWSPEFHVESCMQFPRHGDIPTAEPLLKRPGKTNGSNTNQDKPTCFFRGL
jgi:hypothetical protein